MLKKGNGRFSLNRYQLLFALLLSAVLCVNLLPELRAEALYLLTDGEKTSVLGGTSSVSADRIVVVGAANNEAELYFDGGHKVTVTTAYGVHYASSRSGESVSDFLKREQISVSPLEMVLVDVSGEEIRIWIDSDFTYYETAVEAAAYVTVYTPDYTAPKGRIDVTQEGQVGTREVIYEVTYADGQLLSRRAVEEKNNTSVPQLATKGTRVITAQDGDTIDSVITHADGSGYLLMESGDTLRFTGSMAVKCTAYTAGEPGVGTKTATGTTVKRGVVAVDKNVIPLGTTMFITTASGSYTYGMGHAEDTGVRGAMVDLYMDTYDECVEFGIRNSVVYFLDMEA